MTLKRLFLSIIAKQDESCLFPVRSTEVETWVTKELTIYSPLKYLGIQQTDILMHEQIFNTVGSQRRARRKTNSTNEDQCPT